MTTEAYRMLIDLCDRYNVDKELEKLMRHIITAAYYEGKFDAIRYSVAVQTSDKVKSNQKNESL